MADLDKLKPDILAPKLIESATGIAGPLWVDIRTTARHEFAVLGQRVSEIGNAVASGEMSMTAARILFRMAKRNLIATIAMLTVMVEAAAQKLINGVLKELKSYVNDSIGFALL